MTSKVIIGTWHEVSREITRCPSYYAADTETLLTIPGDYPVVLTFEGGYTVPMPYWVLVGIPTTRISGRLYSGFGGVNFASTPLKEGEAVTYTIQTYAYLLGKLVEEGRVTLRPGFDWLLSEVPWRHDAAPHTWDAVRALRLANEVAI